MKEICIDVRMLYSSGIGTYIRSLLPHLDQHFKLVLIGKEAEISTLNLKKAEVIRLESPIYSIKEQLKLPYIIPSTDIFWSPHYNIPLLPIKSRKRITTIHDVFHLRFSKSLNSLQKIYANIFLKAAVSYSDKIITVSRFSENEINHFLHPAKNKVKVIYNGVNEIFSHITSEKIHDFRKNKNLPENFILFIGNIKPHKNLINLIKAFALLKKDIQHSNLKLVIAGKKKGLITKDNSLEKNIQEMNLQKDILLLEDIKNEELPLLYNLSKLLVMPSLYEGFGLPPLEAMKCFCPVVTSDIPCFKEIYQDAVEYFDPYNPADISRTIDKVIQNDSIKNDLISKGSILADELTWEKSANLHLSLFEEI